MIAQTPRFKLETARMELTHARGKHETPKPFRGSQATQGHSVSDNTEIFTRSKCFDEIRAATQHLARKPI